MPEDLAISSDIVRADRSRRWRVQRPRYRLRFTLSIPEYSGGKSKSLEVHWRNRSFTVSTPTLELTCRATAARRWLVSR